MTTRNEFYYFVKSFFTTDSGKPFILTEGQEHIISQVLDPDVGRLCVKTYTQYGKSDILAIALIILAILYQEKILIVAPDGKQAGIIMGRVIQHLFDHAFLTANITWSGSLERLKQERSKRRITFLSGSEIMVLTADAHSLAKEGRGLMGFGATIVVIDEASLLNNILWSKILRMVGGQEKGRIIKLGNPWNTWDKIGGKVTGRFNHFYRAFKSDRYEKISVDFEQGIKEGRLTRDFINEAKEELDPREFLVQYECKFPPDDVSNPFFSMKQIRRAQQVVFDFDSPIYMGIDVARGGGDLSVITVVAYLDGKVRVLEQIPKNYDDTMALVGLTRNLLDTYNDVQKVAIDAHGVGGSVLDAMRSTISIPNESPNLVFQEYMAGRRAVVKAERFANTKTEVASRLVRMFRNGEIDLRNVHKELPAQLSMYARDQVTGQKLKISDPEGKSPDYGDSLLAAIYAVGSDGNILISDFAIQ